MAYFSALYLFSVANFVLMALPHQMALKNSFSTSDFSPYLSRTWGLLSILTCLPTRDLVLSLLTMEATITFLHLFLPQALIVSQGTTWAPSVEPEAGGLSSATFTTALNEQEL